MATAMYHNYMCITLQFSTDTGSNNDNDNNFSVDTREK